MKIAIPLTGTRGDVQPAVALGLELRRRGHDVLVGAPPNLVEFTERAGLDAVPCGPDVAQLYSSEEGQRALAAGSSLQLMRMVGKQMDEYGARFNREVIEVCRGADVVVSTLLTEDRAASVTEASDTPLVTMHGFPGRASRAYPFPGALPPDRTYPGVVNALTWGVSENVRRLAFLKHLAALRKDLGLRFSAATPSETLAKRGVPEVQIYDPAFVPGLAEEWDERRPLVGFLELGREAREAIGEGADQHVQVLEWIDAGEPPLYCGFGSMPIRDAASTVAMVERVARSLDRRVLVSAGWSDLAARESRAGDRVHYVGAVAHDVVFERCAAAVHHGGIGTTFESLRAGLPTLVCSVSFDQPMWGGQLTRMGVGAHVPFVELDEVRLTAGLRTVLRPDTVRRARDLGARLRARTDATTRTAAIVEAAAR
ncbi:glycosyltransferase [Tsukamurella sp. PLM1]|uniref:glycosyltransferase n=1 Tax=Tsukamurella sp. PLM1 TaxID=2929795 RepID=UPI00206A7D59|nr:glycosyltransferase [Tsukamurella sp. PLM1]BDH56036.1 putative glycosyltransferase [Tsukamurella sp. PLM1]